MNSAKTIPTIREDKVNKNLSKLIQIHRFIVNKDESITEIMENIESFDLCVNACLSNIYKNKLKDIILYMPGCDIIMSSHIVEMFHIIATDIVPKMSDEKRKNLILGQLKYESMIQNIKKDTSYCKNCKVEYEINGIFKTCTVCAEVKQCEENATPFEDIEEIRYEKKNINKHLYETIKKIYGSPPNEGVMQEKVIIRIKEIFKERKIDIRNSVHYIYSLLCHLKKLNHVFIDGKKYEVSKCNNQLNYILLKLYPDLMVPRLSVDEYQLFESTFLRVSAIFQQMFPGKYGNNYMYTAFKLIYSLFPHSKNARNLLRFIYIQKPMSFEKKDTKLIKVNQVLQLPKPIQITPPNVYNIKSIYMPEE